ncbi:hypothetical protein K7X08_008311 [Anisodus acutangulus]|uniref:Pectinesterase inhibitor domain-containing protein n=1 Tax=Anisodus acutangulus TaxID=402998 RepID=A0A9Q1MTP4_9SOLA|nr:hypothetical protein K7X08_008311 [Anisodus acutangulus]
MASLFVEQGDAMKTTVSGFQIPPASMSSFDILSVAAFIFIYRQVLDPLVASLKKSSPRGLTELQRMGVGLIIAIMAMVAAGIVEHFRLKYANQDCSHCTNSSSLSIFWQVPQYVLIGASEVFMYVGQLEFFNGQAPDGLKSFGNALRMTSISLGNYVSSLLVSIVIKISTTDKMPGWIPGNLNKGHLDRFYFLLAALTTADFVVLICAKWCKYIEFEQRSSGKQDEEKQGQTLIQNTCKTCSKDDPNIQYGFCTTSLQAAPASQCATLRGLGMISIRLIRYNVTDTRCNVKILLKDKNLDPYVRRCLMDCFELYSDAITYIKLAMKSYNTKKFYDANIQISSIMDAATTCEDGFKEKDDVVSPLTKKNEITFQLSAVALSVMNLIKNNV